MAECNREVEFAERLTKTEELAKSNHDKIIEVVKRQDALDSMATSMAVIAEKQTNMSDKLDNVDQKVTELEKKPAERNEKVIWKIVELLLAALVGFVLSRIGL